MMYVTFLSTTFELTDTTVQVGNDGVVFNVILTIAKNAVSAAFNRITPRVSSCGDMLHNLLNILFLRWLMWT
jgi:hypothetical protein